MQFKEKKKENVFSIEIDDSSVTANARPTEVVFGPERCCVD